MRCLPRGTPSPLLCSPRPAADKHGIPKVDNTNVDRSVATIHSTVLGCLRRTARVRAAPRYAVHCAVHCAVLLLLLQSCRCRLPASPSGRLPPAGPASDPSPRLPASPCFTPQGESVLSEPSLSCKLLLEEYLRCQSGARPARTPLLAALLGAPPRRASQPARLTQLLASAALRSLLSVPLL